MHHLKASIIFKSIQQAYMFLKATFKFLKARQRVLHFIIWKTKDGNLKSCSSSSIESLKPYKQTQAIAYKTPSFRLWLE
jgi:hypothetical protein